MPKKRIIVLLAFLLVLSIALMAALKDRQEVTLLTEGFTVQAPDTRAACTMTKTNGNANSYWSGYDQNTGAYTYYDPAVECGPAPYPFEITAFTFILYDYTPLGVADVDIVVYDQAASGNSCDGLGPELCRMSVTVTNFYPNAVTYTFPSPCCVTQPFFIGIEYPAGPTGVASILFDDNQAPDTCDNWQFYIDGAYYEWYDFWAPPPPGYPIWWVDGETVSPNCGGSECTWNPGDPHKMHYPQLPDEAGWDVNATQPMILADDFMCMQSGPITDIHFWGSWKHGIEGQIVSFWFSIHEDIPADPPQVPYSRPGVTLWEREVTDFAATPKDPPSTEGWYDPATGEVIYDDHQAYFQYDVCFDPTEPDLFVQDSGTIYWLNISAIVVDPEGTTWGWKSTQDHWNDDAVWAYWGELDWIDIWEPAPPLANNWGVTIDPTGLFVGGWGDGAYNEPEPWFYYPEYDWWNVWFYDHPYDPTRRKTGFIEFDVFPFQPGAPMWIELAVNWSTDQWSIDYTEDSMPPPPGVPEDLYIGRQILFSSDLYEGHVGPLPYEILDYNPEWVSVDVRGYNFDIPLGLVEHTCQGSLDLAFVITGEEPPPPDSGACCYDPTGGPGGQCIYTTITQCEQILGGVYQGDGVQCQGDEACCLPDGSCVMADALCCVNELGGTPQGPGSVCLPPEACCFADGSCQDLDPQCCVVLGGTPQGVGSSCGPIQACCMADGTCRMLTPECCTDLGGTPQGAGSDCAATIACCLPDGTCQTVSRVCCDDMGGTPSPFGAPQCLGDLNGDGTDDACQIREDLKWRQAPDLDPTGIDVDASCQSYAVECLVLSDDFECTTTGPITEIHVYGSWYEEMYPSGDPGSVSFTLSLHRDVPAGVDLPYSHPGEILWMQTFIPGQFMFRPYAEGIEEGFFNPIQQFYLPVADFICWEYIFIIQDEQFIQEGTSENPVIYWLDVQANPLPSGSAFFGWKTSLEHWNDDAVWTIGNEPIDPFNWMELIYPLGHPFELQSIDLAFEIYGQGGPCDCIPGDANNDGAVNVGDAVYIISYVFKGGPAPVPYPICSGDANCDCQCNVGDAVYVISYVFKGGPPPCDCPTWLSICGPPLRK